TDRLCLPMPLFHVGGNACGPLAALVLGAPFHPLLGFDAGTWLEILARERCTFSGGVPTMLLALLQHPDLAQHDLSALRLVSSGGAPVPVALLEEVRERLGADVA